MIVLKCVRVRLLVFILVVVMVWLSFYYSLKSSTKELSNTSKLGLLKKDSSLLDITVYYECLCPDSRSFFISQLLPAVEKIYNLLKIEFIPYGKAKTEIIGPSKYKFTCQHGFQECLGNKIHSCVVSRISDELKRTQVLTCMIIGTVDLEVVGKKCADKFNLDWDDIWHCADGQEGNELLKLNGDKTHGLKPEITFIPTILLNHEWGHQPSILKDLWKEICLKFKQMGNLPKECLPN